MSTCPLYGNWVTLITQPPNWPLPANLLIRDGSSSSSTSSSSSSSATLDKDGAESPLGGNSNHQFLGGANAQHLTDPVEKDAHITRARMLGARSEIIRLRF